MPTLAQYRRSVAVESGPYIGQSVRRARDQRLGTTKLVCSKYPIVGIPQNDLLTERPLYRPTPRAEQTGTAT